MLHFKHCGAYALLELNEELSVIDTPYFVIWQYQQYKSILVKNT